MLQSGSARLGAVFLVAAIVVVLLTGQGEVKGADATAIWLAGRAFAEGQFDQIYNVGHGVFTMTPPSGWAGRLAEQGISDQAVYPFVYPPLWAWFAAYVLPEDLRAYLSVLHVVNAACLVLMAGISWRICGRYLTPLSGVAIAIGIMIFLPISLGERYSMVNFGALAGVIWLFAFLWVCWPKSSLRRSDRATHSST